MITYPLEKPGFNLKLDTFALELTVINKGLKSKNREKELFHVLGFLQITLRNLISD
jgi:hypothetical protein